MELFPTPRETPGDRLATQENLAYAAMDLFSADFCAVQAVNPITEILYGPAVTVGQLPEPSDLLQAQLGSLADHARKRTGLYIENRPRWPRSRNQANVFKDFSTIAAVAFHTKREKKPMAILILGFRKRRKLAKLEKSLLKLFTEQWLPILENTWLLGRYREVVKIGHEINQTLTQPHDLCEQLFDNVSKILNTTYFFMLAIYHPPNQTMDYHMVYKGEIHHQENLPLETIPVGGKAFTSGCAYVIHEKKPLVINYYSTDPNPPIDLVSVLGHEDPNPESLIFVPLLFRDEPLGVLSIQHLHANAFDAEDLHIMTLLGNQVALALSDLRLFRFLRDLNEAGQQLTSELSSISMLDSVVNLIQRTTRSDIVVLYPYVHNNDLSLTERFGTPHISGNLLESDNVRPLVREDDIAWLSLQRAEPIWAVDSAKLFDDLTVTVRRKGNFEVREAVASTAVMVLRIENEPVGVLFVNYRHRQVFNSPQKNFIRGLATFAAIAINNNRRFSDLSQSRLVQLETLREIDLEISKSLNLDEVLETILRQATKVIPCDDAAIFLFNPLSTELETRACLGANREKCAGLAIGLVDSGIVPWVYKNKEAVRVGDVVNDLSWKNIYCRIVDGTRSELDAPIQDGDDVIGVINLESLKLNAFSEADESFLTTLAGQAVLAIKNAQIYEEADKARRSLESLHEVTKEIIAQRDDPDGVIRFILSQARSLVGAEISLFQQYEGEKPTKCYIDSANENVKNFIAVSPDLRHELGIVKHVADTKLPHTTIGVDAQADGLYRGNPAIHSECAVPLLTDDNILIGVLDLESPRLFAFDAETERVLGLFGELALIAIKNALAYNRAEVESQHAQEEAERFQLLWQTGSELAEIIDPSDVKYAYEVVIAKIGQFSGGEVVIRRYDSATEDLLLAASGQERSVRPTRSIHISKGINGQVARELRTILVDDVDNPPIDAAPSVSDDPTVKTLVVIPLLFERSYYGNLVLSDDKPHSLIGSDVALLEGLAKQLAITIHRLEVAKEKLEVERHARDLRVMSDFGQSGMEIAHRLGNVLGAVAQYIGNIKTIIQDEMVENPLIEEDLDRVERNVKALLSMANGLRQRIPELGQEHVRTVVPVRDLLEVTAWSVHTPESIIAHFDIEDDLPNVAVVYGQVIDILRNLFINAVEAMPDGGQITISASYNAAGTGTQHVVIQITDDGPGIPLEMHTKVFNLFYSTKESSGFGLWSARQYARANSGDLTLSSGKNAKGATFTLTLPVAMKRLV